MTDYEDNNLKTISLALTKLSPKSGEVIVIKFPRDVSSEYMSEFASSLNSALPIGVVAMCAYEDIDINKFSEDEMNVLGWYRLNSSVIH